MRPSAFFVTVAVTQDYMQVLSMFAGFGFDWPPAIKGIFNAFSLVNFNFELLAPECSVSLNFEAKWFVGACIVCDSWHAAHSFELYNRADDTHLTRAKRRDRQHVWSPFPPSPLTGLCDAVITPGSPTL